MFYGCLHGLFSSSLQLWRVVEMSDVFLVIVDLRFPVLHFPPTLYQYITRETNKSMILILNKIDFVPAALAIAWKQYFAETYPSLKVILFGSAPRAAVDVQATFKKKKPVKQKRYQVCFGAEEILEACKQMVAGKVNLDGWKERLESHGNISTAGIGKILEEKCLMEWSTSSQLFHGPSGSPTAPPGVRISFQSCLGPRTAPFMSKWSLFDFSSTGRRVRAEFGRFLHGRRFKGHGTIPGRHADDRLHRGAECRQIVRHQRLDGPQSGVGVEDARPYETFPDDLPRPQCPSLRLSRLGLPRDRSESAANPRRHLSHFTG